MTPARCSWLALPPPRAPHLPFSFFPCEFGRRPSFVITRRAIPLAPPADYAFQQLRQRLENTLFCRRKAFRIVYHGPSRLKFFFDPGRNPFSGLVRGLPRCRHPGCPPLSPALVASSIDTPLPLRLRPSSRIAVLGFSGARHDDAGRSDVLFFFFSGADHVDGIFARTSRHSPVIPRSVLPRNRIP